MALEAHSSESKEVCERLLSTDDTFASLTLGPDAVAESEVGSSAIISDLFSAIPLDVAVRTRHGSAFIVL